MALHEEREVFNVVGIPCSNENDEKQRVWTQRIRNVEFFRCGGRDVEEYVVPVSAE